MVFPEALTEYLVDGLNEALANAEEYPPPIPLSASQELPQISRTRGEGRLSAFATNFSLLTLRPEIGSGVRT